MGIAVKGATGFIGKPLIRSLLGAGYEVRALSRDAKRPARVLPVPGLSALREGTIEGRSARMKWNSEVSSRPCLLGYVGALDERGVTRAMPASNTVNTSFWSGFRRPGRYTRTCRSKRPALSIRGERLASAPCRSSTVRQQPVSTPEVGRAPGARHGFPDAADSVAAESSSS